jgi:hypothetical protein
MKKKFDSQLEPVMQVLGIWIAEILTFYLRHGLIRSPHFEKARVLQIAH